VVASQSEVDIPDWILDKVVEAAKGILAGTIVIEHE
jgi:hypothetical protein